MTQGAHAWDRREKNQGIRRRDIISHTQEHAEKLSAQLKKDPLPLTLKGYLRYVKYIELWDKNTE